MGARLLAVLPRFGAIVVACLLASAAVTFAADQGAMPPPTATTTAEPAPPEDLVVPDVRGQVYVFAKGALEDTGFAWKVEGPVAGYAANTVASQSPAPGTRLVDTGAPLIVLTLARSPAYPEKGEPENASPYGGTAVRLAGEPGEAADTPMSPGPETEEPAASAEPAAAPATPAAQPKQQRQVARTPAFAAPGAPAEPQDEISLPQRAKELGTWLARHPKPTDANVKHWLYQHEWIVAGARFGWSGGVEALELLVAIDRRVEALWGVGTRSRLLAEAALEDVRAKTG
jgi:hypothetical protein